jgi:hypothetical protein
MLISHLLTGLLVQKKLNPWVPIAIWDSAGVQKFTNISEPFPHYNCATSDSLVFGEYTLFGVNFSQDSKNTENSIMEADRFAHWVLRTWLSVILNHPIAYIKHRLCVAFAFLGFSTVHYPLPHVFFSPETLLAQKVQRSPLNLEFYGWFEKLPGGFMFRYKVYLGLTFLVAITSFLARTFNPAQKIAVLSIVLSASRVLILPATDFRYGLWIIVGTIILLILFANDLISRYCSSSRRGDLVEV